MPLTCNHDQCGSKTNARRVKLALTGKTVTLGASLGVVTLRDLSSRMVMQSSHDAEVSATSPTQR